MIYMIEAGELSGRLSDVLRELAVYYGGITKQRENQKCFGIPVYTSFNIFFDSIF